MHQFGYSYYRRHYLKLQDEDDDGGEAEGDEDSFGEVNKQSYEMGEALLESMSGHQKDNEDAGNYSSGAAASSFSNVNSTSAWWLRYLWHKLTWKEFRHRSNWRRKALLKKAADMTKDVEKEGTFPMQPFFLWFRNPMLEEIYQVRYRGEASSIKLWVGLICLFVFGISYLFFVENIDEGSSDDILLSVWVLRVSFTVAIITTSYITHAKDGCFRGDQCMSRTYHWLRACAATIMGFMILWRCVLEPADDVYFRLVGIWSIGWQAVVFMYASLGFYEFTFFNLIYSAYYLMLHYRVRDMGPDNPALWMLMVFLFFFIITLMREYDDRTTFIDAVKVYQQIGRYRREREKAKHEERKAIRAVNDKRQFISYIFHEIRVPLSAVRMGVDGALYILQRLRSQAEQSRTVRQRSSNSRDSPDSRTLSVNTDLVQTGFDQLPNRPLSCSYATGRTNASSRIGDGANTFARDMPLSQNQLTRRDGMYVPFNSLEDLNECLSTMYNSMEQAMRILDDVLSLNKVEAGRFELFPGYFKIATLIEEETAKQRHVAQSRRIDLKISIDDDDDDGDLRRVVIGDHVRLCQVFDNFLSNALKFTPSGGQVIAGAKVLEKYELPRKLLEHTNPVIGPKLLPSVSERINRVIKYSGQSKGDKCVQHREAAETIFIDGGINERSFDPGQYQSRIAPRIYRLLNGMPAGIVNERTAVQDPVEVFGGDENTTFEFYDGIDPDEQTRVAGSDHGSTDNDFVVTSPGPCRQSTQDTLHCVVGEEEETKRSRVLSRQSSCSSESTSSWVNADHGESVRMGSQVLLVRLWVRDTGCGLSPEDCKLVFDAYQQTGVGTKKEHSTGLGLTIAQHITRLHGGSIHVHSDGVNEGATFYIDIPLRVASKGGSTQLETPGSSFYHLKGGRREEDNNTDMWTLSRRSGSVSKSRGVEFAGSHEGEHTVEQNADYSSQRLNALIVDDSDSNSRMLTLLLNFRGFSSQCADDGVPAVENIRRRINDGRPFPTVIFMDYSMPQKNGPDATHEIRSLGYQGVIIGITGNTNREDEQLFRDAGADIVLRKPMSAKTLDSTLFSALGILPGH